MSILDEMLKSNPPRSMEEAKHKDAALDMLADMLTEAALKDPDADPKFKKGLLIFNTAKRINKKLQRITHAVAENKLPDDKYDETIEYLTCVESGIDTYLENNNF